MPESIAELPISVARERFAEIVNNAAFRNEITYITRHGKRVAAIVPISALKGRSGEIGVPKRGSGAALKDLLRKHAAAHGLGDSSWAEEHAEARRAEITQESAWDEG